MAPRPTLQTRQAAWDLQARGDVLDHAYTIYAGELTVAEISKRWFRRRDTFGVEIVPGQDDVPILALAVAVDAMAHPSS